MMEAAPKDIDTNKIADDIKSVIDGEVLIHDFHVWAISTNKYSLSCHIICENPQDALADVTKLCKEIYNIDHTTF